MRRLVMAAVVADLALMASVFVLAFTLPPERVWIVGPLIAVIVVSSVLAAFFAASRAVERAAAAGFGGAHAQAAGPGVFRPGPSRAGGSGSSISDRLAWLVETGSYGGPDDGCGGGWSTHSSFGHSSTGCGSSSGYDSSSGYGSSSSSSSSSSSDSSSSSSSSDSGSSSC